MTEPTKTPEQELHRQKMQAQTEKVDAHIAAADVQFCAQNRWGS